MQIYFRWEVNRGDYRMLSIKSWISFIISLLPDRFPISHSLKSKIYLCSSISVLTSPTLCARWVKSFSIICVSFMVCLYGVTKIWKRFRRKNLIFNYLMRIFAYWCQVKKFKNDRMTFNVRGWDNPPPLPTYSHFYHISPFWYQKRTICSLYAEDEVLIFSSEYLVH